MTELNHIAEAVEEIILDILNRHYEERLKDLTGNEPIALLTSELESTARDLMKLALATIPVKLNMALHEFLEQAEFIGAHTEMLNNICDMDEEMQVKRKADEARAIYNVARDNYDFAVKKLSEIKKQYSSRYEMISEIVTDINSGYIEDIRGFDVQDEVQSEGRGDSA